MRNLSGKQRIPRKFSSEISQQLERGGLVFFPHVGNRQQDSGKGSEVVSVLGGRFEIGNSTLLVGRKSVQPQNPSNRRRHAADQIFAEAGRQQRVVAVVTHRQQLLRRSRSFLGEMQRRQIALLD